MLFFSVGNSSWLLGIYSECRSKSIVRGPKLSRFRNIICAHGPTPIEGEDPTLLKFNEIRNSRLKKKLQTHSVSLFLFEEPPSIELSVMSECERPHSGRLFHSARLCQGEVADYRALQLHLWRCPLFHPEKLVEVPRTLPKLRVELKLSPWSKEIAESFSFLAYLCSRGSRACRNGDEKGRGSPGGHRRR